VIVERKQADAGVQSIDQSIEMVREALAGKILQWTPEQGLQDSALQGVGLIRSDSATSCTSAVYEPCMAFIVQGSKTLQLGDREIVYGPLSYLASSVHLPVLGQVIEASPEEPYLAVKMVVDPQEVTDLVLELGDKAPELDPYYSCPEVSCGLCVAQMELGMLDAVGRLIGLLDTPADAPILAPLARREILYRALMGEMGARMRKFAVADSQANRISRVIALLKDRYTEPLRVRDLAQRANMSESSLFHSFKQVTRMSPLQFQKKLRLHEARRLMLSEGLEAASASYRVGYESPSHFSREYSRMFGAPPRADVSKLRGEQQVSA
jgi:AraC-like DNA-binding protein